jgi:hypothetical protein
MKVAADDGRKLVQRFKPGLKWEIQRILVLCHVTPTPCNRNLGNGLRQRHVVPKPGNKTE